MITGSFIMISEGEIKERRKKRETELRKMVYEEYENFKIMVKNQVQKRRIKKVGRWLHMMLDYEDKRMVALIKKYLKEVVDNDGRKD